MPVDPSGADAVFKHRFHLKPLSLTGGNPRVIGAYGAISDLR